MENSGELEAGRSTAGFANRMAADAGRREQAQAEYVEDFHMVVVAIPAFHPHDVEPDELQNRRNSLLWNALEGWQSGRLHRS